MAIYSGFTHKKWWFSIVMLVYQRVYHGIIRIVECTNPASGRTSPQFSRNPWDPELFWSSPTGHNIYVIIYVEIYDICNMYIYKYITTSYISNIQHQIILILYPTYDIEPISGWWFQPSWKIWVRQWEGWQPIYIYMKWKIKAMFQTTNQIYTNLWYMYILCVCIIYCN